MDIHPTPFPVKHRSATASNHTKKDRDRTKPSIQPAPLARPKRVFGIVRNTNIPAEKPLPKPSKPWKPSGNNTSKSDSGSKTKVGFRKSQHVCFQKTVKEEESNNQKRMVDAGEHTPALRVKGEVGMPYLSAVNCSKCRFDKLETSAYWLGQIKIAESVGRHFVSAAFFRLASECNAQPFRSLQSELKNYIARHQSVSPETQWIDLCQLYGLPNHQSESVPWDLDNLDDAVLVEQEDLNLSMQSIVNSETLKDKDCFGFDFIDNPLLDISDKDSVTNVDVSIKKELVDVKAMPNSSQDSPCKNKTSGMKSFERNVS